ncbi:MAG: SsgA family sporulation/cell division regulator [Nocardioidaceae bacterium]|nr:SsgA family sporulation/cell division regulator [Nocardioidaceae bacterium]NUS52068.1 SsgA family sporulation/cell division regulator [Nocardioidaceae bacterium]
MERLDGPTGGLRIGATLVYDPADPFAVSLVLDGGGTPVRWTFGRELLVRGVLEPAGEGDVVVFPALDVAGRAVVVVELSSPDGILLGQLLLREVLPFVRAMTDAVPLGAEAGLVDVDGTVARLLASSE